MRRFLTSQLTELGVLLLVSLSANRASAQAKPEPGEAKVHLDRGLALYQSKEYSAAATELAQAYQMSPSSDLLYALAQARRLADDCPAAVPLYRKYLDEGPPPKEAELARKNLARCEDEGRSPVPASPSSAPIAPLVSVAAVAPLPKTERAEPTLAPWYADLAGDLLLGGAVASYGVATGLYLANRSEVEAAVGAARYDDVSRHVDRAAWDRGGAWIAGAAGSGFLVAAILRFTLRGPAHSLPAPARTAAAPTAIVFRF